MNTRAIQVGVKKLEQILVKESPTILISLGVTGMITTIVLAIKATPRALYLLERDRNYRENNNTREPLDTLSKLEVIKVVWKCYIPTVLIGAAAISCIIGANSINLRRNAALASIYALTEATLKEYQEKVIEVIGKNKEEKIHDEIAQDRLNRNPLNGEIVILTGRGETLFYDSLSGRYFKTDIEYIRRIQNDFNQALLSEMYKSLNELYHEMGLEDTTMGENAGWNIETGMLDIRFSAKIAAYGVPCIVMDYKVLPQKL